MSERQEIIKELRDAVAEMDPPLARAKAEEALRVGVNAYDAIMEGLGEGMAVINEKYQSGEYFLPQLIAAGDAFYEGLEILKPHIKREEEVAKGRVLMCVVEGDIHDIGKNICKIMLEANGFEVIDLGRNVPCETVVEVAREKKPQLISLTTLMTPTLESIRTVIELLGEEGIRDQFKVMVGGGATSSGFAEEIGADGWGKDNKDAIALAKRFIGV